MGEIVGGVDAPGSAGARVGGVKNAVHGRVAHVHVARSHVDLGAQHAGAVGEFTGPHAAEQIQVLVHRPVAIGAVSAGLGEGAPVGAHVLRRKIVHIGLAGADQVLGPLVQLLEIVGGEVEVFAPVEPQPPDIALDGFDELQLFLDRVGIVEPEVTASAEFLGDAEVETDGLGVADVEIAVGLGRKPRHHAPVAALSQIRAYDIADEIPPALLGRGLCFAHCVQLRTVCSAARPSAPKVPVSRRFCLPENPPPAKPRPRSARWRADDRPPTPNGQGMCSCIVPRPSPAQRCLPFSPTRKAEFAIASLRFSVYPNAAGRNDPSSYRRACR